MTESRSCLLQELFDEVSSFNFEVAELITNAEESPLLSKATAESELLVVKINREDFVPPVPPKFTKPWEMFWVNKKWYNAHGNAVKMGELFPGAVICTFYGAGMEPMIYLDEHSQSHINAIALTHYLVLPIKDVVRKNRRWGRQTYRFRFIGAGFFTEGNWSVNERTHVRDVILFGKPVTLSPYYNQSTRLSSAAQSVSMDGLQAYLDALIAVKELISQQYEEAV